MGISRHTALIHSMDIICWNQVLFQKTYPLQLKLVRFLEVVPSLFHCDLLEKVDYLFYKYCSILNLLIALLLEPLKVFSCIAYKLVVGSRDSHHLKVCMFLVRDWDC